MNAIGTQLRDDPINSGLTRWRMVVINAAAELVGNPVSKHQIEPEYGDEQADAGRDTAEPVSRDQFLRHERGQGFIHFSCSTDHVQDWQPYPVDPYSCYMCDHTSYYAIFISRVTRCDRSFHSSNGRSAHYLLRSTYISSLQGSLLGEFDRVRVTRHTGTTNTPYCGPVCGMYVCSKNMDQPVTYYGIPREFRAGVHLFIYNRHTPSGQYTVHLSGITSSLTQSGASMTTIYCDTNTSSL